KRAGADNQGGPANPVTSATGLGQSQMAFGDVVALDLAGPSVDGGDRRVPGVVLHPAVGRGPRLVAGQEALRSGHLLKPVGRLAVGLAGEELGDGAFQPG